MTLITGTKLGSYEILSLLGAGGMGEVYLAQDTKLHRNVAIKLLLDLESLKHRLEFEAELERSKSPAASGSRTVTENSNRMTAAGTVAPVTLDGEAAQTAPVTGSLASRIKQHRRSLMIALAVLVVAAAGLAYRFYSARVGGAIDSIAVLPLVNASNDPNTEYLSDGISEALINSLTELQQSRVIARSTAFRYKGREVDPQAVGRELNVRAVLMGRVREEAIAEFQKAVQLSGGASVWLSSLGYCYAVTGRRVEALGILKELEEKYGKHEAVGQLLARVYTGLGEKDQAFAWLEKDFAAQQRWVTIYRN